jgi:hypothetical protein
MSPLAAHYLIALLAILNQRSNKAQQLLLLWPIASRAQKVSDLNIGRLTA